MSSSVIGLDKFSFFCSAAWHKDRPLTDTLEPRHPDYADATARPKLGGARVAALDAIEGGQAELDALFDKIGANGMDALSGAEKQRLNELSKRLRKQ